MSSELNTFIKTNTAPHKDPNHVIVTVSIKPINGTPGDATSAQMRVLADIAEQFGYDELRISHEQNVILPHVHRNDLPQIYQKLKSAELHTSNVGLITDIIACPGMDYCALATARSIPIAKEISKSFSKIEVQHHIGPLKIKISGCINACGHHHVGHIGILGLTVPVSKITKLRSAVTARKTRILERGPVQGFHMIRSCLQLSGSSMHIWICA